MSGLILPGIETPRVSRRHRLAAKAKERREGPGAAVPNMQPRQRALPPPSGGGVGMSPIGPAFITQFTDGTGCALPMTPTQAREIGVALISAAAHFEILKKMEADQQSDGQPVPVSLEAEALLAEAIAEAGGPVALKGDEEGDVDDDPDISADPCQTIQFNSFDVNGQPCYEPPSEGE